MLTDVTPASPITASRTALWKWPRIGQPAVVSVTVTDDLAAGADIDPPDHVELDDRAVQLGVDHDLERLADLLNGGHLSILSKRAVAAVVSAPRRRQNSPPRQTQTALKPRG